MSAADNLVGPVEKAALESMHSDPFVQSAIRTVYLYGPPCLNAETIIKLARARAEDRVARMFDQEAPS